MQALELKIDYCATSFRCTSRVFDVMYSDDDYVAVIILMTSSFKSCVAVVI